MGPKSKPCGTPQDSGDEPDMKSQTETVKLLNNNNSLIIIAISSSSGIRSTRR